MIKAAIGTARRITATRERGKSGTTGSLESVRWASLEASVSVRAEAVLRHDGRPGEKRERADGAVGGAEDEGQRTAGE